MSAPILDQVKSENKKLFLQFGGQGSPWLKELSKLYAEPALSQFFEVTFQTLEKEYNRSKSHPYYTHGLDLKSWLASPDTAPAEEYLSSAVVSVSAIFITQVANYHFLTLNGYSTKELIATAVGTTGHSQGIIGATLIALGKEGDEFLKAYSDFLSYIFYFGLRAQQSYPTLVVPDDIIAKNLENGDKNPAPMVAVIGYSREELEERVGRANQVLGLRGKETVYISLFNTPDSMILSALPSSLLKFRTFFKPEMDERKCKFVYLRTSAPFHCPFMNESWGIFEKEDVPYLHFPYSGSDLKIPVYSIYTGENLQSESNLRDRLFKTVLIEPLHWDKAVKVVLENPAVSTILDFGPSSVAQKLTGGHLKALNLEKASYCLSSPKEVKVVFGN